MLLFFTKRWITKWRSVKTIDWNNDLGSIPWWTSCCKSKRVFSNIFCWRSSSIRLKIEVSPLARSNVSSSLLQVPSAKVITLGKEGVSVMVAIISNDNSDEVELSNSLGGILIWRAKQWAVEGQTCRRLDNSSCSDDSLSNSIVPCFP